MISSPNVMCKTNNWEKDDAGKWKFLVKESSVKYKLWSEILKVKRYRPLLIE